MHLRVIYAGRNKGKSEPFERMVVTLCRQCPGGCGLRVRVVEDRVVGIAGNPMHPINRGGVCARAPAAVQTLYNPDRLARPAVLAGAKGSGHFRPITWSDALEQLAVRLRATRNNPGPHSVVVMANGERGLVRFLWDRFLQAYGSNNLIEWSCQGGHRAPVAVRAMQGVDQAIGYDLARANYVLSFGSQWLDDNWSPVQASCAFAELRGGYLASRPKFVHLEARLSLTGAKADEWIPLRPGTEGALAMGLAHVLLREGLYDRKFVDDLTHGFDDPVNEGDGRIGYRRLVLRDYAPSEVAKITGVEEGTIFRLAREFALHKPALAIGFDGFGVSSQRCYDRMAIHSLNALVGSIDVPGGVTHFEEMGRLNEPVPKLDELAEKGLAQPRIDQTDLSRYPLADVAPDQFAERILAGLPYPVEVLVLAGVNPVFDSPHPERVKQALAKVPFVVSLSPWLDDSARYADMVVPDTHFLTRWDIDLSHTLTGQPTATIGQPAVPNQAEAQGTAALLLEMAQKLGEPMSAALPYQSAEAVVREVCDSLHASGRGGPFGHVAAVQWTQLLERSGWQPPRAASAGEFYQRIIEKGGWYDPIYHFREWDRVLRSPRRRFAFYSVVIADRIRPVTEQGDVRCLPHHEPALGAELDEAFPLRLYVYPLAVLAGLADVNIPWLMDACGVLMQERWESWLEINPATAHRLRIADGDMVQVTSPRGKIRVKAKLFEGIMPEVVAMPWGLGHEGGGRWSDGVGQSPSKLVETQTDPATGSPYWNLVRVSVQKA
jgi:anaerobic selenocysteine-containing dehydrogenase